MHQQNKLITETQPFNSSPNDTSLLKTAPFERVIGCDKYGGSLTVILQKDPNKKVPKKKPHRKPNRSTQLRKFFKKLTQAARRFTRKRAARQSLYLFCFCFVVMLVTLLVFYVK